MSRQSARILSRFWTSGTGEQIVESCSDNALILSLYLMTNSHAQMCGVYVIRMEIVAIELHKEVEEVWSALAELENIGFVKYDRNVRMVWVLNMMKYQGSLVNQKHYNCVVDHLRNLPQDTTLIDEFMGRYCLTNLDRTQVNGAKS